LEGHIAGFKGGGSLLIFLGFGGGFGETAKIDT